MAPYLKRPVLFPLSVEAGRSVAELYTAGKYGKPPATTYRFLSSGQLCLPTEPEKAEVQLISLEHDSSLPEILQALQNRELAECRHYDALYFGEQYPEEQHFGDILFIHASVPWYDNWRSPITNKRELGDFRLLCLSYDSIAGRHLATRSIQSSSSFSREVRFAARRLKAS